MLINVKVKTLDGQNHEFSVDNEITVREFKDKVAEKTTISADQQRVIYCGRVMVDDKQLKEYDVDGKVVHVAERPPPSQRLPNTESASTNGNPVGERRPRGIPVGGGLRNSPLFRSLDGMVVGTMAFPVNGNANGQAPVNPLAASSSFCMNRITVARHMLDCANNIAAFLEDPSRGLNNQPLDILTRGRWTMESTVVEVGITSDIPQSQQIVQMVQGAVQAALRRSGNTNVTLVQLPTVYSSSEGDGTNATAPAPNGDAAANATDATATDADNAAAAAASVVIEDVIVDDEDDDTPTNEQTNDDNTSNANAAIGDEEGDNARESSPVTEEGNNEQLRRRTGTRVLARVIEQLRNVQTRLSPFVEQYYDMLLNEPSFEEHETERRDNAQRLFDRVSEAFHYLSHAQHAISDLMLDVSQPSPRFLTCRPILVEQSGYVRSNNFITPAMIPAVFRQPSRNSTATAATAANAPATAARTAASANTSDATNTTGVSVSTNSSTASSSNDESNSTVDDPIDDPVTWPPTLNFGVPPPPANDTNASNTNNNNAAGRGNFQRQVARLLQDVVSAAPFDTEFHVHINSPNVMSFDVPVGGPTIAATLAGDQQNHATSSTDNNTSSPGATTPPTTTNATTTPASASTPSTNANPARVTTATLPTTSTQTRSTARPQVHIGNIPVLSMPSGWNGRAMPTSNVSSFDRFMPCNSHHIRDLEHTTNGAGGGGGGGANNANGNSNQASRNHGTRANIFRRLPLRYRLRRPTRGVEGATITSSLSTAGRASSSAPGQVPVFNFNNSRSSTTPPIPPAREAVITDIRHLLESRRLNFERPPTSATSSAAAAANSTSETRRLNMHNKLMNLIKYHIFEGKPINDENMPPAINRAVQWFGQALIYLPQYEKPEYDSMDSIFNILRKTLPLFIKLINRTPPNLTEFEQKLKEICEQFRKRMYSVIYVCTGRTNAELYWGQLMSLLCLSIQSPSLDDEVVEFLTLYLNPNIPSGADEADAQQFIVYRNVSNSSCDRAGTTPMDTDVEMTDVAGTSQSDIENETLPAVVPGTAPWHRNFPNDWLPIITRDIQLQAENPPNQPPYSDAYISGMSSKRRKLVQHSKPPTEVNALISDSVSKAIHSAGVGTSTCSNQSQTPDEIARFISNDSAVQASCIEAVRVNIRERLKTDTDYDPEKFPKTTKFIQK